MVWLHENPKLSELCIRRDINVPLPTPEGPTTTKALGKPPSLAGPAWVDCSAPIAARLAPRAARLCLTGNVQTSTEQQVLDRLVRDRRMVDPDNYAVLQLILHPPAHYHPPLCVCRVPSHA